jgi:methionine-S-sulfoxide reductase
VGYTGGKTSSPAYRNMGDHSEALEITYDPDIISYRELLDEFWEGHDPTHYIMNVQYRSYIFFNSEAQKKTAEESLAETGARTKRKVYTEIKPLSGFTQAENYHQKYYLQMQGGIKDEFLNIYPRMDDLLKSTAAARINGYAAGYGSLKKFEGEVDSLGLSGKSREKLKAIVSRGLR